MSDEPKPESPTPEPPERSRIVSLTDYFDQLERISFARALDQRRGAKRDNKPPADADRA